MTDSKKPTNKELLEKKPCYCVIEFDWSNTIVLPQEDALKLIEAIRYAETYSQSFKVPHPDKPDEKKSCTAIVPLKERFIKVTTISQEEYLRLKMTAFMEIYIPKKSED
jgi:hypothetical protein